MRFEEQFWFFWGRNVNYSSNKTEFSCILQYVKRLKIFFPFCGIWLFASACATYQKLQLACLPHSSLHSFPVCWRLFLKFPFLCHFISFPSISLGMSHWQSLCNLQKYYIHRTVILTHGETADLAGDSAAPPLWQKSEPRSFTLTCFCVSRFFFSFKISSY